MLHGAVTVRDLQNDLISFHELAVCWSWLCHHSPQLKGKAALTGNFALHAVFAKLTDPLGAIGPSEFDHATHLLSRVDNEGVWHFFTSTRMGKKIFTTPSGSPLWIMGVQVKPNLSNAKVMRCLQRMLEFASIPTAIELR